MTDPKKKAMAEQLKECKKAVERRATLEQVEWTR